EFSKSILVLRRKRFRLWSCSRRQMGLCELHDPRHQVAETICEIGVVGFFKALKGKVTVLKWVRMPRQKQTQGIDAIIARQSQGLNDITEALAHLLAPAGDEA